MRSEKERDANPVSPNEKGSTPLSKLVAEASTDRASASSTLATRLATVLSTGFGLGYSPVAPGTLGAALGVGIYRLLLWAGALHVTLPIACVLLFGVGVHICSIAERRFHEKDCQKIVFDELASFPLTMLFISPTPLRVLIAFALNRAADILKPFPADRIQRLKSGWGVMLDDTVAAIYANLLLRLIIIALKI